MKKISVIGLGKLGLPLTAAIASKGFFVYGVDINEDIINNLNKGKTTLTEPGLQALITKNKDRIIATGNLGQAVQDSEITFIITPTPSKPNGYFSNKYIEAVIKDLAKTLKAKTKYHSIVIVSTVMPGSMDEFKNLLEKSSGKKCGRDFGLCYSPEFIALGSVIYNLLNPDFILIGESDKNSGDILQQFYKTFCNNKPQIARMNFVNAELTKISVNTFVTTKISYANMLTEICEKLPGGNIDIVTSALGLDSRIGRKYLSGGPSFGGPCFPRDNIAFISLARKLKSTCHIAHATHKTNIQQINRLARLVKGHIKNGSAVGILGLSYKPFTDVIDESSGLLLARSLAAENITLNLHDPLALKNTEKALGLKASYVNNLRQCIVKSHILVIATNWPEYKGLKKSWFGRETKILIDAWRIVDPKSLPENVKYIPLGLNNG